MRHSAIFSLWRRIRSSANKEWEETIEKICVFKWATQRVHRLPVPAPQLDTQYFLNWGMSKKVCAACTIEEIYVLLSVRVDTLRGYKKWIFFSNSF